MGNFYKLYLALCNQKGVTPSFAALQMGISKVSVSHWKSGRNNPTDANLQKIADYFGVTVEYLKGEEKEKPLVNNDKELTEYLEELKSREEMRMLFSVSKGCTKQEVEQAVRIIEALRKG